MHQRRSETVKFLIVAKLGGEPLAPDKAFETYKAAQAYGNKLVEDGTHDCSYAFFGGGGIAIANADSADEVYRNLTKYPMWQNFLWEVTPLLDWNQTFDSILATFK
jgi:hypothetical protein